MRCLLLAVSWIWVSTVSMFWMAVTHWQTNFLLYWEMVISLRPDNFVCNIYGYAFKSLHLKNSKLLSLKIYNIIRLNFQKYFQFGLSCKTYKKIFLRPFWKQFFENTDIESIRYTLRKQPLFNKRSNYSQSSLNNQVLFCQHCP